MLSFTPFYAKQWSEMTQSFAITAKKLYNKHNLLG